MEEDSMRLLQGVLLLALVACAVAAYQQRLTRASQQQSTAPKPQPTPPAQGNPNQEINDRYVQQFSQKLVGRENEPAGKVFKNIQIEWFKNVPAGRLLLIMNRGYSRALGVSCTYCHIEQDFASDLKRPKLAAREMAVMHHMINDQLKKMQNLELKPEKRSINCATCHRGAVNPLASEQ
jgi:formate-dependent nitrite reductase cytochrome c552 subunit